ncbi:hypothetical protein [Rariglobus hedericola]|uniref:Tetratricopeptide repeat protein n=1 Tax=Rariglobus hedericola TaxID=2597822 RepID=A0A556QMI6_9BACT|nr:hypothetical protein [Rariglobus hedericola]TSJ77835.1 hypothetical protein FPL22_00580 [Rariglobus hedericola]
MALPKVKLCWNGKRVEADWHLGLFGFYTRGTSGSRLQGIVISGRGLLAWLAGLAVVAYFTGAAALWFWLDRRPYNYVSYTDLVLPTRWSGIEKLRGQALIAEGMDDIKARKWSEGLQKLRVGIARNPEEIKGRLVLAEIFLAMKARKQAIEIYDGGLGTQYPGRDYVEAMLKSAAQSENYEWWLRTCDRALALIGNNPAHAADHRWLIQQKLSALLAADRPAEALVLAEAEGESGSPTISEFRVLALLKEGKPDAALAFLNEWQNRAGSRLDPQILRLQARAFREAKDAASMDRALEELRELSPADPRPYVYGIVQRLLAGRRDEAFASLDSFLLRFGSTPQYLQMLAAPLAEIAERPMLENLVKYAAQQGFDLEPFRRFLLQALMEKGEWREASTVLAEAKGSDKKAESVALWYDLMDAQIKAALDSGEAAQSNLVSLVRGRQFALSFYKDAITNMRRAGRLTTAREIVTFAQGMYPQNNVIETWRKELDIELAAAAELVSKPVVTLPRPQVAAATVVAPSTPRVEVTTADFEARLEALTKTGDYAGALQYLREIRVTKPAWLDAREADLSRDEVRFSGRAGDLVALRSSARLYINGDRLRSARTIEIARELHAAGRIPEAVFLLKELLAKVPDYPVAQRLLAEWVPKPVPTAATP